MTSTELGDMMLTSDESVNDIVAKQVGTLGENLKATQAVYMSAKGDDSYLAHYIHTAGISNVVSAMIKSHTFISCGVILRSLNNLFS